MDTSEPSVPADVDALLTRLADTRYATQAARILLERVQAHRRRELEEFMKRSGVAETTAFDSSISESMHREGMSVMVPRLPDGGGEVKKTEQDLVAAFDAIVCDLDASSSSSMGQVLRATSGSSSPDSAAETDCTSVGDRDEDSLLMQSFCNAIDNELNMLTESFRAAPAPSESPLSDENIALLLDKWSTHVEKAKEIRIPSSTSVRYLPARLAEPTKTVVVSSPGIHNATIVEEDTASERSAPKKSSAIRRMSMRFRGSKYKVDDSISLTEDSFSQNPPAPKLVNHSRRGSISI